MYISRNATLIESEGFSPTNAQRDDKSRNSESVMSRHLRVASAEGKRNENRIHGKEFFEHKKAPKWCCEDIDFLERHYFATFHVRGVREAEEGRKIKRRLRNESQRSNLIEIHTARFNDSDERFSRARKCWEGLMMLRREKRNHLRR